MDGKFLADWKPFGNGQSESHKREKQQAGISLVSQCFKLHTDPNLNFVPLRQPQQEPKQNQLQLPDYSSQGKGTSSQSPTPKGT